MYEFITVLRDNAILLLIGQYPNGPLGGLTVTIVLSSLGVILAFPLSIVVALFRLSIFSWLRWPAVAAVYAVRGVPLIMFIFWVYFFVPLLIGRTVSGFMTMLVTLVIYEAAYLSEIIRAGIEGIPRGQMEAARASGLSYWQTTFKVILPQAIYNMVPALISQCVSVIKDTSLASVIGVNELTFAGSQVNNALLTRPFEVFLTLAGIYMLLGYLMGLVARTLEERISRKRTGIGPSGKSKRNVAIVVAENAKNETKNPLGVQTS